MCIRDRKKSYWLSISVFVLILIWTVYYYAMQYTGGFADLKDSIVCGIVGLICICLLYTSFLGECDSFAGGKKSAHGQRFSVVRRTDSLIGGMTG